MSSESTEESDNSASVSPTPSRRSVRARSCVSYGEPNYSNLSGSDNQDSLKRRLEEFLGEDSGSDKDFVPKPSSKKKVKLSQENDSGHQNRSSDSSEESSSDDGKSTKSSSKKKTMRRERSKLSQENDVGNESESTSDEDEASFFDEEKKIRCIEFSDVLRRPSVLKRLEGPSYIAASVDTPTNSRKSSAAWRCLLTHLRSCLTGLTGKSQADRMFSLIRSCLNTQSSSLLCALPKTDSRSFEQSKEVNTSLGHLIIDTIISSTPHAHLQANKLFQFGEWVLTVKLRREDSLISRILKQLYNLGALRQADNLVNQMNQQSRFSSSTGFFSLARNLSEIFRSIRSDKTDNDVLSVSIKSSEKLVDDVILVTDDILKERGDTYTWLLPLYTWYVANNKDVEMAMDVLVSFRNENLTEERGHKFLIEFLTEHQFEPEVILQALQIASDHFPYVREYVVAYCQKLFQRDEDLETSFDSEQENESDQTRREELSTILRKLIKCLDFSYNVHDEIAWQILVNCSHQLVNGFHDGAQILRNLLIERTDWWFGQVAGDLECSSTVCLGHKLVFLSIVSVNSAVYTKVLTELQERREKGDMSVAGVLSHVEVYTNSYTTLPAVNLGEHQPDQQVHKDIVKCIEKQKEIVSISRREAEYLQRSVWYNKVAERSLWYKKVAGRKQNNSVGVSYKKATSVCSMSTLHAKNPTFLRNFLYMSRDTQFEMLEHFVDWYCHKAKNVKVNIRHKPKSKDIVSSRPDLNTQPWSYKESIVKVLKRNLEEKKTWRDIVKEEFHYLNSDRTCSFFRKAMIFRMQRCVDWTELDHLQIPDHFNLDHKLKITLLARFHSVARSKLNPRLALRIAESDVLGDIRTVYLFDQQAAHTQTGHLQALVKFIDDSI